MGEEVQKIKKDAPVKVDEGPKRFVEKGPHVVLDTKTNIFWFTTIFFYWHFINLSIWFIYSNRFNGHNVIKIILNIITFYQTF